MLQLQLLGPQEDLDQLKTLQLPLDQVEAQEVDCLVQSLLPQRLVVRRLELGQHLASEIPVDLVAPRLPQPREALARVSPQLTSHFLTIAALGFGQQQQQNASPVPVTGSMNPPYQITSEKEPGQTYSTNFHAISMMPAYRNASFEVHISRYVWTNIRNYVSQITHKDDGMAPAVRLAHPPRSVERRQQHQVDSAPLAAPLPIQAPQEHLVNQLNLLQQAHLDQVDLARETPAVSVQVLVHSVRTRKLLLKQRELSVLLLVLSALGQLPVDLDQILPEDSDKRPEQGLLDQLQNLVHLVLVEDLDRLIPIPVPVDLVRPRGMLLVLRVILLRAASAPLQQPQLQIPGVDLARELNRLEGLDQIRQIKRTSQHSVASAPTTQIPTLQRLATLLARLDKSLQALDLGDLEAELADLAVRIPRRLAGWGHLEIQRARLEQLGPVWVVPLVAPTQTRVVDLVLVAVSLINRLPLVSHSVVVGLEGTPDLLGLDLERVVQTHLAPEAVSVSAALPRMATLEVECSPRHNHNKTIINCNKVSCRHLMVRTPSSK
jgi:hypothetical protein